MAGRAKVYINISGPVAQPVCRQAGWIEHQPSNLPTAGRAGGHWFESNPGHVSEDQK